MTTCIMFILKAGNPYDKALIHGVALARTHFHANFTSMASFISNFINDYLHTLISSKSLHYTVTRVTLEKYV